MAPTKGTRSEIKEDIWADLLGSLQTRTTNRGNKNIVLLGPPQSGKSTLIHRMRDSKDMLISGNPGVEFNFLTVRDEEREHVGRIGIHATSYKQFLGYVMTKDRLKDTAVVITLPLDKPWNLDEELFSWTSLVEDHIKTLEIEEVEMKRMKEQVRELFSSYKEPVKKSEETSEETDEEKKKEEEEDIVLPLTEGALVNNLGVPLIVVLTKVDSMMTLQKENDFSEEHFEYIQWHLRKACLGWGAALLYCSPRENSNTKLLLDYMSHVFYGLRLTSEPQVVDRDAIFVPIGWDSLSKISLVSDGFVQFKQATPFADQISALPDIRQKRTMKGEDDQLFLTRMQAVLIDKQKTGSPAVTHKVLEGEAKGGSTKTPPPADGVLANFFNSLLTKKPGSGTSTPEQHSPSPPPAAATLVPPKKALAPRLSAPKEREEIESKPAPPVPADEPKPEPKPASKPEPKPEPKPASKLGKVPVTSASRDKSPAASKLPSSRDKSPATTGMRKPGSGVKKPAVKRGLPQPRK